MINYQLANGKTVRMTEEQYFKMSDQDFKDLEGTEYGSIINDPFYDSALLDAPQDYSMDDDFHHDIDEDFLEESD